MSVDSPGMQQLFPAIVSESAFNVPVDVPVSVPVSVPVDVPMSVPVDVPAGVPAGVPFLKVVHVQTDASTSFALPPSTLQHLLVDKGCFPNVREAAIVEQAELVLLEVREGAFRRVETMEELKAARRLRLRDCPKLERVNVENGCFAHYTSFEVKSSRRWRV